MSFHLPKGARDDPAQEANDPGDELVCSEDGRLYVDNVAKFARHFGKSPELLGEEEVRQYLVYLVEERKLAWGSYTQALVSLRLPLPVGAQAGRRRP